MTCVTSFRIDVGVSELIVLQVSELMPEFPNEVCNKFPSGTDWFLNAFC